MYGIADPSSFRTADEPGWDNVEPLGNVPSDFMRKGFLPMDNL